MNGRRLGFALGALVISAVTWGCEPGDGANGGADDAADASGEVAADSGSDAGADTVPDAGADADVAGDTAVDSDVAADAVADSDATVDAEVTTDADAVDAAETDASWPYCPGAAPPPLADSCRSQADCGDTEFCRYPGQEVCGICRHPENTCDISNPSTSCGEGLVCISRLPSCACSSEEGTYCVLGCAADPSSCGTAECLPSGFCAPESCLEAGVD